MTGDSCVHCGGSGILNVIASMLIPRGYPMVAGEPIDGEFRNVPYATTCHACEMGKVMAEVGVDA